MQKRHIIDEKWRFVDSILTLAPFRETIGVSSCLNILGTKNTRTILLQLKKSIFIRIIRKSIQKMLNTTEAGDKHTYINSKK